MDDIDAGHVLQQFAGQMIGRTDAGRTEIERAGFCLGERDQPLDALHGSEGCTISTIGTVASSATGTNAVAGSNGRLL